MKFAVLHGDKTQAQRQNIIEDFKTSYLTCVVATDVAARGLDVKDMYLFQFFSRFALLIGRLATLWSTTSSRSPWRTIFTALAVLVVLVRLLSSLLTFATRFTPYFR
jgi:hypothetical protein